MLLLREVPTITVEILGCLSRERWDYWGCWFVGSTDVVEVPRLNREIQKKTQYLSKRLEIKIQHVDTNIYHKRNPKKKDNGEKIKSGDSVKWKQIVNPYVSRCSLVCKLNWPNFFIYESTLNIILQVPTWQMPTTFTRYYGSLYRRMRWVEKNPKQENVVQNMRVLPPTWTSTIKEWVPSFFPFFRSTLSW